VGARIGIVAGMTVASLVKGLLALVALLIAAGLLGGIGSVELLVWLGLVAAWIGWWAVSRRATPSEP
jgi:hypothetical protein